MGDHRTTTEQPQPGADTGVWTDNLDRVSAMVALLDAGGRILRVNRTFAEAIGCAPSDLDGCELWELVEADHVDAVRRIFSPEAAFDRPRLVELEWLGGPDSGGSALWYFSAAANGDGEAKPVLGVSLPAAPAELARPLADGSETTSGRLDDASMARAIGPLLMHASDVFCLLTTDGEVEYVSPAVERVLGYRPESLVGTNGIDLVHPGDIAAVAPVIARGNENLKTPQEVECRVRHADSSWRTIHARGVTYADGDQARVIVSLSDVTSRRQAEQALAESESRFRSVFDSTALGKVLWTPDGRVVKVNRAAREMLGYTEDEMLAMTWTEQVHGDDIDQVVERIRELTGGVAPSVQLAIRVRHRDGPWIWTQATVSAVHDADGRPRHIIGELEDITANRRADDEQRSRLERMERHQAAIISMATGEAMVTGERDRAFAAISRAAAEALGVDQVAIWLLNDERDSIRRVELSPPDDGGPEADPPEVTAADHPVFFETLSAGRVLDADDALSDPRTRELVAGCLRPAGVASLLAAPIRVAGKLAGIVCHAQLDEPRIWHADEITFAAEVADQVAHAMASAHRKRAERRLQMSEERFRSIITCSPMGVLMYRLEDDGRLVLSGVNPAADAVLGVDCQQFIGKTIEEAFPSLADTEIPARYRRVATSGDRWQAEQIEYRDELIHGAYEVHAFQTAPKAVTVMFKDITDRKRSEDALRESEERYRLLFERNLAGVYRSTLDGRILDCNEAFAVIVGCSSRSEALTRNAADFYVRPTDRTEVIELLLETTELRNHEMILRRPSGDLVWVLANMSLISGGDGGTTIIEGTMIDITQRKRAADRLVLQSTALESTANAIVITDADGVIEWVNYAFTKLTGYHASEAIGESLWMLKSGRDHESVHEEMLATVNRGEVWRGELVNRRKDGRLYTEEMTITPVEGSGGGIRHFVAVQQDVSDRKRMEEQLLQAQKMEAVGRLAGGVAHDFNNLLQAMLGVTELLRQPDADANASAERLQELEELVQRGSQLTRQLLLFSRRDTARQEELQLNDVVRGTVKLLHRLLRENIELAFEPAGGNLLLVADRGQIEQVVMNLAVNACDAMPHGGRLQLTTGSEGGSAWLEVSDTGEGIPEEIRGQLFEPFFTTKEAGKGTGLGLSVVHGIISRLGGRIDLESEVGKGTSIRVTFPAVTVVGPPAPRPPDRAPISAGEGEHLLVVEDDPAVRESLEQILGVLGYRVTTVGCCEEAARLPDDSNFELLLSDFVLPDGTGTEIASELRGRWPDLSVVVMSGYAQDDSVSREAARGNLHFLQKPFNAQTLGDTIRLALLERTPRPPHQIAE